MTRDDIILDQIEAWLRADVNEDLKLRVKEESKFMKFLNFFVQIFNKRFMTGYITTLGSSVYFPGDRFLYARGVWKVLTHEGYHLWSAKKKTMIGHGLLYALPQWLALLTLLSLLAIPFSGWWLLNLLWLLCLAPLPAYFRMREEMEAYVMSMCNNWWLHGSIRDDQVDHIAGKFLKGDYYWMWPFKKAIYKRLKKERLAIINGEYDNVYPYSRVREIIQGSEDIRFWPPRG